MAESKNTDARRKASKDYLANKVEDIRIRVPKGSKEHIKAAADAAGESLNAYIVSAIKGRMVLENRFLSDQEE